MKYLLVEECLLRKRNWALFSLHDWNVLDCFNYTLGTGTGSVCLVNFVDVKCVVIRKTTWTGHQSKLGKHRDPQGKHPLTSTPTPKANYCLQITEDVCLWTVEGNLSTWRNLHIYGQIMQETNKIIKQKPYPLQGWARKENKNKTKENKYSEIVRPKGLQNVLGDKVKIFFWIVC